MVTVKLLACDSDKAPYRSLEKVNTTNKTSLELIIKGM